MTTTIGAQPVFTGPEIFPLEEFSARRARVMERMGDASRFSRALLNALVSSRSGGTTSSSA